MQQYGQMTVAVGAEGAVEEEACLPDVLAGEDNRRRRRCSRSESEEEEDRERERDLERERERDLDRDLDLDLDRDLDRDLRRGEEALLVTRAPVRWWSSR